MIEELMCPSCGFGDMTETHHERILKVPYGPDAVVQETYHKCNACDFEGDITVANDGIVSAALDKSNTVAVAQIIKDLESSGITMRYFERALRLPVCMTDHWREGRNLDKTTFALLKLIRTYPQLLEVADHNFNEPNSIKV